MKNISRVTLDGVHVRLEPLMLRHHGALCRIGLEPDLWKFTTTQIRSRLEMKKYIEEALRWQKEGTALPFAIFDKPSGQYVGSTRYAAIDPIHRRLEIGWTWIAPTHQRTHVNTETKYLLLQYAFEELHYIRVEFKTDSINNRSRRALLRIGAREEGTLRNHMITSTGRIRHSVYYSILDSEWKNVKKSLEMLLFRGRTPNR